MLPLLVVGRTYKEIAAELCIAFATAKEHVLDIYVRLGVQGRSEIQGAFLSPEMYPVVRSLGILRKPSERGTSRTSRVGSSGHDERHPSR